MRMTRGPWHGWDAVTCTAGDCELIAGVSAGPRILSLRWRGGANLLYRDTTDFRVGQWRLFGGHRFTVAPETDESYTPDNVPCTVHMDENELRLGSPCSPTGVSKEQVIRAAEDGDGFDLCHILENQGDREWHGALWAITCVPRVFRVLAPRSHPHMRFWPGTNEPAWRLAPDHLTVEPDGSRGKSGWYSDPCWLALLHGEATFLIHNPDPPRPEKCVDGGCNLEVFISAAFTELETLGGSVTLAPGGRAVHHQRWRLLAPDQPPQNWPAIAGVAGGRSLPAPAGEKQIS